MRFNGDAIAICTAQAFNYLSWRSSKYIGAFSEGRIDPARGNVWDHSGACVRACVHCALHISLSPSLAPPPPPPPPPPSLSLSSPLRACTRWCSTIVAHPPILLMRDGCCIADSLHCCIDAEYYPAQPSSSISTSTALLLARTAGWLLLYETQTQAKISIGKSDRVPNADDCSMIKVNGEVWCRFPFCGFPQPNYPAWSAPKHAPLRFI